MRALIVIIAVVLRQHIAHAVTCASNPCVLVPGVYDTYNGYCCYDVPPNFVDAVCTCPNNAAPVVNRPCRTNTTATTTNQGVCNRPCVNGGVCNIVNGSNVCWCTLGYSGTFCELQGMQTRCTAGLCQSGICYENSIGASLFAYCSCNPGWTGTTCNQQYFTCTQAGVFPDTAFCAVGRYFYCPQANGAPIIATCPDGQKFNRLTSRCEANGGC